MSKSKIFSRVLCVLLCTGLVFVGCTEGSIDDNINNESNNTELPGSNNNDNTQQPGDNPDNEDNVIANNEIWYTTTDNQRLFPSSTEANVFGAYFISNTFSDGKGVITFDGDVTKIGDKVFQTVRLLLLSLFPIVLLRLGIMHSIVVPR